MMITFQKNPPAIPPLNINGTVIESVKSSKLLGIIISDDLKWNLHVDSICSKASRGINFLSRLHRSGMEHLELVQYYTSVIRSVLEYACPAWFTSVKHTGHMWELELIQIRSLKIIFPELSYKEALIQSNLCTLEVKLTKLYICSNFFNNMQNESHMLHYLLPETHNRRQLRHTRKYEPLKCRTQRFRHSFVINHIMSRVFIVIMCIFSSQYVCIYQYILPSMVL